MLEVEQILKLEEFLEVVKQNDEVVGEEVVVVQIVSLYVVD